MCRVSVFICGKEHVGVEDACRIVPAKQPAVTGGHYEKGVSARACQGCGDC